MRTTPERSLFGRHCALSWLTLALLAAQSHAASIPDAPAITPSHLPRLATVDERFQSYNIEMVEITGGRFWRPYRSQPDADTSREKDSNLFQYRLPIDLNNSRLRKLAAALAPAYLRVSGTWANATYFADSDTAPSVPPPEIGRAHV